MNVSIILAHPDPASFNHAIAAAAAAACRRNGHRVFLHDLHQEKFDPLLPAREFAREAALDEALARHCAEIASARGIVVVHPNWWGMPPAILKGWIDRVLRPGVAYRFDENDLGDGVPAGLLQARAAVVFNTSNTPAARERAVFGDPLETLWKNCIFDLCVVREFHRRMFGVIVTSAAEQRREWLAEVGAMMDKIFPAEAGSGA